MSSIKAPVQPENLTPVQFLVGAAWAIFAIAIWAGWMVVTRFDLQTSSLGLLDITAIRFATAAVILLPIVWRHGFVAPKVGIPGTLLMAAGSGALYALVAGAGLLFAPAAHAGALIPGVMPLFAAVLSVVMLGESFTRRRLAGLALIPLGVLLIAGLNLLEPVDQRWIGHLLFLSAALLWASFTVTLRRSGIGALHGAALVAVWSALLYLPIYALALPSSITDAGALEIGRQALLQGVLTSVVSLVAFSRAITILGASRGALFAALVPGLASVLAVPVLGEHPSTVEWAGIGVVTFGVLLGSTWTPRNSGRATANAKC